jgi:hypothetical protein
VKNVVIGKTLVGTEKEVEVGMIETDKGKSYWCVASERHDQSLTKDYNDCLICCCCCCCCDSSLDQESRRTSEEHIRVTIGVLNGLLGYVGCIVEEVEMREVRVNEKSERESESEMNASREKERQVSWRA